MTQNHRISIVERLQVLVALKRRNRAVSLSIPVCSIYLAIFGVVTLLVASGFLVQFLLNRYTDYGRLNRLVDENYRLKARLTAYSAAVDSFRLFMARTEGMDNRLRAATDLCMIPADVRRMGVGGVVTPSRAGAELDELMGRMRFEEQSMVEIDKALKDQEHRLSHLPSIWPVQGWVTSGFGMRRDPFTRRRTMHNGMDIVAPYGTAIVATADGRVRFAGWKSGWGRCVEIDHNNGIVTFYAHCRSLRVKKGDDVERGKTVATVGSSGRSTGTHLHYGVKRSGKWVNPRNYIVDLIKRDPS